MRDDTPDEYGVRSLQEKELEIMAQIDKICSANDIRYYLSEGTALGAQRHQGFIPWDDDMDIMMFPDDYERFRAAFERNGDQEHFYLQEWGKTDGMITKAKLRMNGTAFIQDVYQDWKMHHGVFVDIFILHNCPDGKIARKWQYLWAKYLVMRELANINYTAKNKFHDIVLKFMRLFPKRALVRFALKRVYKYRGKQTKDCGNYLSAARGEQATYPRAWFGESVRMPFEKMTLPAWAEICEFLTLRYGDYMKIPDEKKIHPALWDVERDFSEIDENLNSLEDEKNLV